MLNLPLKKKWRKTVLHVRLASTTTMKRTRQKEERLAMYFVLSQPVPVPVPVARHLLGLKEMKRRSESFDC